MLLLGYFTVFLLDGLFIHIQMCTFWIQFTVLVWSCNFTWDHYFCKLIIYLFQYPFFRTGFHLYLKIQIENTPFFRDFSSNTSSSDEFAIEAFFFDLITFKGADSVFSSFNRFRLGWSSFSVSFSSVGLLRLLDDSFLVPIAIVLAEFDLFWFFLFP